jgi:hypothetical protein
MASGVAPVGAALDHPGYQRVQALDGHGQAVIGDLLALVGLTLLPGKLPQVVINGILMRRDAHQVAQQLVVFLPLHKGVLSIPLGPPD